MNIPVLFWIIC